MFVEQRVYSLVPGGTAEYIQVYEDCGRAVQERILGPMLATTRARSASSTSSSTSGPLTAWTTAAAGVRR